MFRLIDISLRISAIKVLIAKPEFLYAFYKGAQGDIIAYDCTRPASFTHVKNWVRQTYLHGSYDTAKILIGNKCDHPDRVVTHSNNSNNNS